MTSSSDATPNERYGSPPSLEPLTYDDQLASLQSEIVHGRPSDVNPRPVTTPDVVDRMILPLPWRWPP